MDKSIKVELITLVCFLLAGLLIAGGIFVLKLDDTPDNATSRALAEHSANRYLSKYHPESDYAVSSIVYEEKEERYRVRISSEKSADSWFWVEFDAYGKLTDSSYEDYVGRKGNTAQRISIEYGNAIEQVLSPPPGCTEFSCYAGLYYKTAVAPNFDPDFGGDRIISDELELDGIYDVAGFGSRSGWVSVTVEADDASQVTEQNMADLLLYIRGMLDNAGLPFYDIDCSLEYPKGTSSKYMRLNDFLYTDIYEEGLVERVTEELRLQTIG